MADTVEVLGDVAEEVGELDVEAGPEDLAAASDLEDVSREALAAAMRVTGVNVTELGAADVLHAEADAAWEAGDYQHPDISQFNIVPARYP